jgi:DnaJ-class molecular chaperone
MDNSRNGTSLYEVKRCAHCGGRGELYNGAPDAVGVSSEPCDACGGSGKQKRLLFERQASYQSRLERSMWADAYEGWV